jgi:2-iminoacetate synthase
MKTRADHPAVFIDEAKITATLAAARHCDPVQIRELLAKARQLKGLDAADTAALMNIQDPALLEEMFAAARWVKNEI